MMKSKRCIYGYILIPSRWKHICIRKEKKE
jgi:hypothetical protein